MEELGQLRNLLLVLVGIVIIGAVWWIINSRGQTQSGYRSLTVYLHQGGKALRVDLDNVYDIWWVDHIPPEIYPGATVVMEPSGNQYRFKGITHGRWILESIKK